MRSPWPARRDTGPGWVPLGCVVTGYATPHGNVQSDPGSMQRVRNPAKRKMGKACLYIRRLDDLDPGILEQLIAGSVAEVKRLFG